MLQRLMPILLLALLLAGCGEDKGDINFNRTSAVLAYSYPYQDQREVPPPAPLILHFSSPLSGAIEDIAAELTLLDEDEQSIGIEVRFVSDRLGLVVTPVAEDGETPRRLQPATDYRLLLGDLVADQGEVTVPENGIRFRTRAETNGPLAHVAHDGFHVSRVLPDRDSQPMMDFSSLRMQMSRPVDRASIRYGQSVGDTLFLEDSAGNLVPATVLVQGHYITIDPDQDLQPGETYILGTPGGIRSILGDVLPDASIKLVPQDSAPRNTLVQQARDSDNGLLRSRLTGDPINAVPVKALLLGDDTLSQQEGDVFAELADLKRYPDISPLRVPRGSLLEGASISVDIAGEVPAGFDTGKISVTFLSDASGYLLPNEYNTNRHNKDVPKHVRMIIDVAMTAEDSRANGALSQSLLHVELAGIAFIRDGVLEVDAVGIVEPEVLGLERAWGLLSFNMVAYQDQKNAPQPPETIGQPALQSWTPGEEHFDKVTPGEPIVLNFDRPIDPRSIDEPGALGFSRNGASADFDAHVDGASIVIRPHQPLRHPRPGQPASYQVMVSAPVRDLAGNEIDQLYSLDIELPMYQDESLQAPIVLTTYPGYPCPTSGLSVAADHDPSEHHGRCIGGQGGDDLLPVPRLPANRPIRVTFSQDMDLASISDNGSFQVENLQDGTWQPVAGRLNKDARTLLFYPDIAWQPDVLYRYTLRSNDDSFSATADCSGSPGGAICSVDNLPLQTRQLSTSPEQAPSATGGGPPLTIHFRAAEPATTVLQSLRKLPSVDTNANFLHEPALGEQMPEPDGQGGFVSPYNSTNIVTRSPSVSGPLFSQANVGCGFTYQVISYSPNSCPENRYIYLTGALDAEILGYDEAEGAIAVDILPTRIMTSNLDVAVITIAGLLLGPQDAPTGPQVMRFRYRDNTQTGRRDLPARGWIRETEGGPVLEAELDLYLDAPALDPEVLGAGLNHNQRSFPMSMKVAGPIHFLDDGRMHIVQHNVEPVNITVTVGGSNIRLRIPEGGVNLSFISEPVK